MGESEQDFLVKLMRSHIPRSLTSFHLDRYNNSFPDMWAFMTLSGPSATKIRAKQLAQGAQSSKIGLIPGFDNVDIYNLVTQKLLGLKEVAQNNGTVGYWDQYL